MTYEDRRHDVDPLDAIWLAAARALGVDAHGAADAAAVFQALCRALVLGERAEGDCEEADPALEHACQRLQAALADRHGLRARLAATRGQRAYWDALPDDPLAPGTDPAIEHARAGWIRSRSLPWRDALHRALARTAELAHATRVVQGGPGTRGDVVPLHRSGMPLHRDAALRCGACAWLIAPGARARHARCRQTRDGVAARGVHVGAELRACQRFEPRLHAEACGTCGACCREGFDLVQVRPRERMRRLHPNLVIEDRHGPCVPRPGGRCVALDGTGAESTPYRCRVYADRPRACADFAIAGDACLTARRRVGLSK